LLRVDVEAVPDRPLAVVIALEELAPAVVAEAGPGRRLEQDVPDPAADPAGPATG